jgi:hypothetical protein
VKGTRLAQGLACACAFALSSCYWLAQYGDLSSDWDAGSNTGARLDAGQPFCPADAGSLAYCMDFDGVDAQALDLEVNEASASIVNGPYVSPPSSLRVALEGAASFGRYDVSFPFQPTTTRLDFEVQGVGVGEGITTLAVTLLEPSTGTARTLNVVVAPDGSFEVQEYFALADGGTETNAHSWYRVDGGAPPAWYHVVLTLTVDDATRQYTSGLAVNDEVLEDGQPLGLAWGQGNVTLNIGVTYAAAGGTDFYFDNVRADFTL